MKTPIKILAVALAFAALAYGLFTPIEAKSNPNRRPESIFVSFKPVMGEPVPSPGGSTRYQIGLASDWTSASDNAPEIPIGTAAGEVVAFLIGQGYSFQVVAPNQWVFIKQ